MIKSIKDALGKRVAEAVGNIGASSKDTCQFVPPGHFYSPIPSLDEVRAHESAI